MVITLSWHASALAGYDFLWYGTWFNTGTTTP